MPRLTDPNLEKEITEKFLQGNNVAYLSELYNIPKRRINRILKRNGIESIPRNMLNVTIKEREKIVNLYNKGFSTIDIQKHFFSDKIKCDRTIAKILRDNGVELRGNNGDNSIIINESFFETIDNEYSAYYLGLLFADGNVRIDDRGNHLLQLELEQNDSYLLERLVELLGYKLKVKDYENETTYYESKKINLFERENRFNGYSKTYKGSSIQVTNKKIYEDLNRLNMTPNKTLSILPPNIPKDVRKHFIRGYFDGDGSVLWSNNSLRVCFYGQDNILSYIKNELESDLSVNNNKIFNKRKENVSMLTYGKADDVKNIYNYLYEDASIYMKRKREKLNQYMSVPR